MKEPLTCLVVDIYHRVAVQVQIENLRKPASWEGVACWYADPTERERAWAAAKTRYPDLVELTNEYLRIYDGMTLMP